MADINNPKHFILVHGACHGAWCWKKLETLLESASNRVTLVDLAASGTNMKKIEDVETFDEYSEPLLDFLASLQPKEKVILVRLSLGGMNVALAAEKFPNKIAVAVFVTAFMPDTTHKPSFFMDQCSERTPAEAGLDNQFFPFSSSQRHLTAMLFGPIFLSLKLYQLSPPEVLTLSNTAMADINNQKHFVLVHGACHGAWCWQKLKTLLESASNRVTLVDLTASGTNMKKIEDVETFDEYTEPLLDFLASLQPKEKVILVGHSLGGINLALAAEKFPNKVVVAVFLTAFMPDTTHKPSFVMDQYSERTPAEAWLDTQFSSHLRNLTTMFFGPKFLSFKLYQLSPPEDLEQARTLIRPGSLFLHDLSKADNFSAKGYGSVKRVYVICDEDLAIPVEFQRWMIENSGADEVMEIKGADHMFMFSKPQELSQCLSEIAKQHA